MIVFFFAILSKIVKYYPQGVCVTPSREYENLPITSTLTLKTFYGCNQDLKRSGKTNNALYISSCQFNSISGSANGGAIFLSFSDKTYQDDSLIYQCKINGCKGSNGAGIYIKAVNSEMHFNITQCSFISNTATKSGGGIYFNAAYAIIDECTFINNIAKNPKAEKGGEIFYLSSETTTNTDKILLIQKCYFERSIEMVSNELIYLKWSQYADFHFVNNKVNITYQTGNVYMFIFPNEDVTAAGTLVSENNEINNLTYTCHNGDNTEIGKKILRGFTEPNPDVPDVPENPNCPKAPQHALILDGKNSPMTEDVVYGCEKEFLKRIKASQCVIYIYHCNFTSIKTTESGGALYLFATDRSNTMFPTPEGNCAIENCIFSDCEGMYGGAVNIKIQDSDRFCGIINCSFFRNKATNTQEDLGGGALYIYATFVTVENCTFVDNVANSKGQQIYFQIYENVDTENPLLISNCTFHQNKVASDSALIFLEWRETADFYFNYNIIVLADDLNAYLFENGGRDIKTGNLSCHANALLPNRELICPKDTDLYERIKRGFQISDTPVEDIVLDNVDACKETDAKHCQTINNEDTYKHVVIEVTKFTDFKSNDNGGAVYLINTGVSCVDTTYSRCSSTEKGGGGAIFLYNNREKENDIDFIGVKINSCSAAFGGGAYVYSKCKDTLVTFKGCTFKGNKAKSSGSDDFFGGGAIYMTVAAARLNENIFSNNKGGILKINEKFEQVPTMEKQKSSKVLSDRSSIVTIVDCKFESDAEETLPSILFVNSRGSKKVKGCVFNGRLAKGTYHIDAQESMNVNVESCKFSTTMSQAFNAKIINASKNNMAVREKSMMLMWFAVGAFAVACCAVVAALMLVKCRGGEKEETDNHRASLESFVEENEL